MVEAGQSHLQKGGNNIKLSTDGSGKKRVYHAMREQDREVATAAVNCEMKLQGK